MTDDADPGGVEALVAWLDTLTDDEVELLLTEMTLSPLARRELERVIGMTARGWQRDPLTWAMHLGVRVPEGDLVDYRHMHVAANQFRKAVLGTSRFQVWNWPSQMQKSTSLRLGVAWALHVDPSKSYIYTGYSNDLCRKSAIMVRDLATSYDLGFTLKPDEQRADMWTTTEGGGVVGHGLHGALAGYPATGGVIIDDPLKDWREAHSPLAREEAFREIQAVARLRLAEGGFLILAHARWHVDDPTGMFLRLANDLGFDVEHVRMPQFADDDDPYLGRELGDVLEPRRYSESEAISRAQALGGLGSYLALAMEQQAPIAETGGELKREWWDVYDTPPDRFDALLSSWDTKLKDARRGDYVAGGVVGRVGGDAWVLDVIHGQFSRLETKVAIAVTALRHPDCRRHIVENAGNGPEVMQELRKADPGFDIPPDAYGKVGVTAAEGPYVTRIIRDGMTGLVPNNVSESKVVRVRAYLAPSLQAREVHVPNTAGGAALIDQSSAFPPKAGGHDDLVDMLSQAMKHLFHGEARTWAPPRQPITSPRTGQRAVPQATGQRGNARILRG